MRKTGLRGKTSLMSGLCGLVAALLIHVPTSASAQDAGFTLTKIINPSGGGQILADPAPGDGGFYAAGTSVTLTANAAEGFAFHHWGEDASGTANPLQIEMNGNKVVVAAFVSTAPRFTLTRIVSPAGSGEIGLQPVPGPDGKYTSGTIVTVKAFPAPGKVFAHWSGAATGTANPVQVTVNENKSVTAFFEMSTALRYSLEKAVTPAEGGHIAVQPLPGQDGKYAAGTTVTLTAVPAAGKEFHHWSGSIAGTQNPAQIIMNANKAVTANFETSSGEGFLLTRIINPVGAGEIGVSPPPGDGGRYAPGTVVTLTAHAFAGKVFHHWSGAAVGSVNPVQITMNENKVVAANFVLAEAQRFTLSRVVNPVGSGEISADPPPGNDGKYAPGTVVTLTAHAAPGKVFSHWSGAATGSANPVQITMNENRIVAANFSGEAATRFTLTTFAQPMGSGEVTVSPAPGDDGKYAAGSVVTVTAAAAEGFAFAHWGGGATGNSNPVEVTMNENRTVAAVFESTSAAADLAVQVTSFPNPAVAGSPMAVTIVVTNNGPADASAVHFEYEIPDGTSYVSSEATHGTMTGPAEGSVRCDVAALPFGAHAAMIVRVTPQSVGNVLNFASVEGEQADPNLDNNFSETSIEVREGTISGCDLTGNGGPVRRRSLATGQTRLSVTFTLRNLGSGPAPPALLQFYLSSDGVLDDTDILMRSETSYALRPGGARTRRFAVRVPTNPQGMSVIAVIDPAGGVAETDESNNRIIFGPIP